MCVHNVGVGIVVPKSGVSPWTNRTGPDLCDVCKPVPSFLPDWIPDTKSIFRQTRCAHTNNNIIVSELFTRD